MSALIEILIIRGAGSDGEAQEEYSVDPSRLVPGGETWVSRVVEISQ